MKRPERIQTTSCVYLHRISCPRVSPSQPSLVVVVVVECRLPDLRGIMSSSTLVSFLHLALSLCPSSEKATRQSQAAPADELTRLFERLLFVNKKSSRHSSAVAASADSRVIDSELPIPATYLPLVIGDNSNATQLPCQTTRLRATQLILDQVTAHHSVSHFISCFGLG